MQAEKRPRMAVGVELVVGHAEFLREHQRYPGERLVDLEPVDVVDGQAGALQCLAGRVEHRGELDDRVSRRDRQRPEPGPRDQAVLLGEVAAGDQQRRRAVAELRRVRGSGAAVVGEHRLEGRDFRGVEAGPDALVGVDGHAGRVVRVGGDRDELVAEPAVLRGGEGTFVAADAEGVEGFACQPELFVHQFRRRALRHQSPVVAGEFDGPVLGAERRTRLERRRHTHLRH